MPSPSTISSGNIHEIYSHHGSVASEPRSLSRASSASRTSSVAKVYTPFHPSVARHDYVDSILLNAVPERPTEKSVFDAVLSSIPLEQYDHRSNFTSRLPEDIQNDLATTTPSTSLLSEDPYLFPRLTYNETDRLTSLYYYTRELQHDKPFLAHLQETVNLVQALLPYDCVILGFMDRDTYTRVVTTNVPLAVLPRREATCAHTINQPLGSVLGLPLMTSDERFSDSPHVKEAGLVSYAGTALRYAVPGPEGSFNEVAFGTLCTASFSPKEPLTPAQERILVRFADIIVRDIVERARSIRAAQRQTMASRLSDISSRLTSDNVEEIVLAALRDTYPTVRVEMQIRSDGTIEMVGRSPVPYTDFHDYMFEDMASIEEDLFAHNHLPVSDHPSDRTLRAIAVPRSTIPHGYLVIQATSPTIIFDDIDAAFVLSCALILCNARQAAELKRVANARADFLRGVSHELRTPIHALLSSCELMVEEAKTAEASIIAGFSSSSSSSGGFHAVNERASLLANALASGRALLNTVNNLLHLDTLENVSPTPSPFLLSSLEASLLSNVDAALRERGVDVQLLCEHLLPPDVHVLNQDLDLLKQALNALLDHAVASTNSGTITFRTSLSSDVSSPALIYEVVSSGSTIPIDRPGDLFNAFEATSSKKGPSLGLPVAKRIATALSGELTFEDSEPQGSRFRLVLNNPALACQYEHPHLRIKRSRPPLTFALAPGDPGPQTAAFRLSLLAAELEELPHDEAAILLAHSMPTSLSYSSITRSSNLQLTIFLQSRDQDLPSKNCPITNGHLDDRTLRVVAPVDSSRMWDVLIAVLDSRARVAAHPKLPPRLSSPVTSTRHRAKLRLLLVDDNKTNLEILRMYCRRRKFAHLTAMDGDEAVEKFKTAHSTSELITLVLMDLQMPTMDGDEATRLIREYETEHALGHCLIYMVSGQHYETDKKRAVEAGANGYYVKPLSIRTLDDLIKLQFPEGDT